jgi:predicted DNA-binding transcriptional regulator YafY
MPAAKTKALIRILAELQVIPIYPKWVSSRDIHNHLTSTGIEVTKRTVERDLMELTEIFGLTFGDSPEGYKWSFAYDSPHQFIPALSQDEALSLKMVEEYLHQLLPSQTFEKLTALFKKSDEVLKQSEALSRWPNLIKAIPQALTFTPITLNKEVIDNVYTALLNQQYLTIKYHKKDKSYKIKPVGILVRDQKLVLVCQYDGFDNYRNLLVHRIQEAIVTSQEFETNFNLQEYIDNQAVAVSLSSKKIKLVMEVKGYVKELLCESTLSTTQKIIPIDHIWSRVEVEIPYNLELENWLQSQIQHIKILEPEVIREKVIKKLNDALSLNTSSIKPL